MIAQLTSQAQNASKAFLSYGINKTSTQRNEILISELIKIQSKLKLVIAISSIMSENSILPIQINDLNYIFNELKKLRKTVDIAERNKIIIELPSKIDRLNTRLIDTWEQKVKADYGSIIQLGNILDKIFNDNKFTMINAYFNNALSNIPDKQIHFDKYKHDLSTFHDKVMHFNMDVDIECFLVKLSKREATLVDIDSKILEWISQNQLAEKIKLTF